MNQDRFYWIAVIFMAISVMFLPFWVTVVIFISSVFFFDNFYPGLVILFTMDALYGFETFKLGPVYGILTIGGILVYILITALKKTTNIIKK